MNESNENRSLQISQLVDGELPADQANVLLDALLDDSSLQQVLREHLRLRGTLAAWRALSPDDPGEESPAVARSARAPTDANRPGRWWVRGGGGIQLLGGALLGGLLVLAGVLAGGFYRSEPAATPDLRVASVEPPASRTWLITPQRQKEVQEVFALHELVAGPLAWMADADQQVRLGEAAVVQESQPTVAVLLRIQPSGGEGAVHEYAVVCRAGMAATVDLPYEERLLRVYLVPRVNRPGEAIRFRYALAVPTGDEELAKHAVLSGERRLDVQAVPLGQMVVEDQLLELSAGGWVF
jgi:hypothetical protein